MYLIDTNIFLEILLDQEKRNVCEDILNATVGNCHISDFSLHSIGVILFRKEKTELLDEFVNDVLPKINISSLPKEVYKKLSETKKRTGLDFDDSYQVQIAEEYKLELITLDLDFKKVSDKIKVTFPK